MLYQSMKLSNGIWVLAELRVQAGNPNYTVSTAQAESISPVTVVVAVLTMRCQNKQLLRDGNNI